MLEHCLWHIFVSQLGIIRMEVLGLRGLIHGPKGKGEIKKKGRGKEKEGRTGKGIWGAWESRKGLTKFHHVIYSPWGMQ